MSKHEHGTMEFETHEKTFYGFVAFAKWAAIVIIAILLFVAFVNG